jgi:Family of unknown function (DUF6441)
MAMKIKISVDRATFTQMARKGRDAIASAAVSALRETAAEAVKEGRADMAASGAFGANWQRDLKYFVVGGGDGEATLQAKAVVFHKSSLAFVFEKGITIQGKPLLWIPTQPKAPRARTAAKRGKQFTSATVRGQPMLFDAADKSRTRKPLYIGVPSIRIPKKWHIIEIVKARAAQIASLFFKHFRSD